MTELTITVHDLPTEHMGSPGIRLSLQTKQGLVHSPEGVFTVQLDRAKNRKGEEQWVGDSVNFHGDGRRFIYLVWQDKWGKMFRRLKLYLKQIPDLHPESVSASVTISGRAKDGTPACATATILPSS
ncbi:MAG TPA: DUF5990 family protein [Fimbriimonas sp.]|nr:DUF5990 family protein [Fimbriimonas sp.]